MQIPKQFPQFEEKSALIITGSPLEAVIYKAKDGKLEEIKSFKTEKPTYSDREGHFERRSHGKFIGSGSSYEGVKDRAQTEFLTKFKEEIKEIMRDPFDEIFLLAPQHISPSLKEVVEKNSQETEIVSIEGNFTHNHPKEVLEKIRQELGDETIPTSEEAQKILKKGEEGDQS